MSNKDGISDGLGAWSFVVVMKRGKVSMHNTGTIDVHLGCTKHNLVREPEEVAVLIEHILDFVTHPASQCTATDGK